MPDFTTSDGLRLHYEDDGAGRPLLCLAGLTRHSGDFAYLRPHLRGLRMIALDYRGRGRSDWGAPGDYTIPTEARDAQELLDHLGLSAAAILGTSRGGLIGLHMASTAKARLTGLCLNDIGPEIAAPGLARIKGYLGRPPVWTSLDEAARGLAAARPGFVGVPAARWAEEAASLFHADWDGLHLTYDPALGSAADGAVPDGLWEMFAAADGLPLAALRGANSDILSARTFAAMQARRPDMIAATVPDRGHAPFLDEPEARAALRAWIDALP